MADSAPRWLDEVLPRLSAELVRGDPDTALAGALAVLAEHGVSPAAPGDEAWLTIGVGGHALSLSVPPASAPAPAPPLDGETRDIIANLLGAILGRVAAQDEHRKVRERADMLSTASFEGIMVHVDGVIIDANQRLAELLAYEPSEILGPHTLPRAVAPEDLPDVLTRMRNRYEGAYVITGVRKDGSRFRAELQSKQGQLGDRPVRVVAVRDVTEREHASALLRESETRLRDLVEVAFDVIVVSRNGVIVEVGPTVRDLLGRAPDDMKGRSVLDFIAEGSRALAERMVREERAGIYEAEAISADGTLIPVAVVGVNSTQDGESVRIAGLRDLRKERRLESERAHLVQQVERAQRMESLGVLAGGIAHDFNNLLVGVLGNAELLLERVTESNDRQAVQAILSAGGRAAALTAQMLTYAGRRELARREPVDLGALCLELRELLDAALSKKARVTFSLEPNSVVLGDRATLSQVLMNLLTNASDALEDRPGTIQVSTRRIAQPDARFQQALAAPIPAGDWILTEVKDTGTGMDPTTLGRVFEPFFSTKAKGHGLGLAACLGIVSAHRGAILVASEPGRGTCFSVLLPATQQPVATPSEPTRRPTGSWRVLVVDDEALVRSSTRRLLLRQGYAVEEASDGQAALAALERGGIDVVLLDMTMPDLGGDEVVRRIRARGWQVPIVLSSGYIDAAAENTLDRSMIQGALVKPFSLGELSEAIEKALAAGRA